MTTTLVNLGLADLHRGDDRARPLPTWSRAFELALELEVQYMLGAAFEAVPAMTAAKNSERGLIPDSRRFPGGPARRDLSCCRSKSACTS